MKYLHEFRDPKLAKVVIERITARVTKPWVLMEVCGGQTHSIIRYGIDRLLPPEIDLIHGPGCPVCVTPASCLDEAIALSAKPEVILCTFADMLRVPGTCSDLLQAKAEGADVRSVYSPLDAVRISAANPGRQVIFFAVGFETTAPANAISVLQAAEQGLENYSLLVSQVLVPPAIEAILNMPENRVQGFLAAGHVCSVMGYWQYEALAEKYRVPIVVTGFEPIDLLLGIEACVAQLEDGAVQVDNQYQRAVQRLGNRHAQDTIDRVFEVQARQWRGLGELPASGLVLKPGFAAFDARNKFPIQLQQQQQTSSCRAGEVLTGVIRPEQCAQFGAECTPDSPLGATMVSAEGACAAYYKYRHRAERQRA